VNPRDEVQGGLTQLTDEDGKPIMVQQFKSGKIQTAPGYGPPREMVLQDVGGKMIAIDKARTQTGSEFTLGMTPYQQFQSNAELQKLGMSREELNAKLKNDAQRLSISERELALAVKRFGLNEQEFVRGNYQVEQAENGNFVYVSKVPGMPSIPVPGTGGKQLSVGMTPMQQADLAIQLRRIGLSEEEFKRGNYELKEADNGTIMYVSKTPGMPSIPVMGASGNPLTVGIPQAEQARLNISLQQLGLSKQEFDQKVKQDALRMGIDQQNLGLALKRYNLSLSEFARGNYKVQETEAGFSYIPTVPGMPTIPITGGGGEQLRGTGGKPTEDQSKSAGFAFRMKQSTEIFNQPILDASGKQIIDKDTNKPITLEQAYGQPGRYQAIMRALPTAGLTTGLANVSESAGRQQYRQAQENWVTANLRPESGAVIGEGEMEKEITKYFPQVNDDAKTIDQKARARRDTELAMTVRAGPAYKQLQQQIPKQRQPRLVRDPQTGVMRYVEE
jgi:hypothetical protein